MLAGDGLCPGLDFWSLDSCACDTFAHCTLHSAQTDTPRANVLVPQSDARLCAVQRRLSVLVVWDSLEFAVNTLRITAAFGVLYNPATCCLHAIMATCIIL